MTKLLIVPTWLTPFTESPRILALRSSYWRAHRFIVRVFVPQIGKDTAYAIGCSRIFAEETNDIGVKAPVNGTNDDIVPYTEST